MFTYNIEINDTFFWLGDHNSYFSQFRENTKSTNNAIRDECQCPINNKYNMKQYTLRITFIFV